jgi:histone H3/H4
LGRIAAWALEHPGVPVRDSEVFRDTLARIRKAVFEEKKTVLARFCQHLAEENETLAAVDQARVVRALDVLTTRFGYTERSARDAAGRLLSERYANL